MLSDLTKRRVMLSDSTKRRGMKLLDQRERMRKQGSTVEERVRKHGSTNKRGISRSTTGRCAIRLDQWERMLPTRLDY